MLMNSGLFSVPGILHKTLQWPSYTFPEAEHSPVEQVITVSVYIHLYKIINASLLSWVAVILLSPQVRSACGPQLPSTQKMLCNSMYKEWTHLALPPGWAKKHSTDILTLATSKPRDLWRSSPQDLCPGQELGRETHHMRMRCLGAEWTGLVIVTLELGNGKPPVTDLASQGCNISRFQMPLAVGLNRAQVSPAISPGLLLAELHTCPPRLQ